MQKLHLLPKLTNDEFNLLLASVGCALQKSDQLEDKDRKQLAVKELLNLYNNIQKNSLSNHPYSYILASI